MAVRAVGVLRVVMYLSHTNRLGTAGDYRCNDNDDDDDQDDEGRLEAQGKRQLRHHSPYCITLELCQHRCQKSEDSQHMQACQAGCGYRCA